MTDADTHGPRPDSGTCRLWIVALVCVVASFAGVAYAVHSGVAAHGGRGGAIAVALAFLMLFLDRQTARDYLEMKMPDTGRLPAPTDDEKLAEYLTKQATEQNRTHNTLAVLIDWDHKHKWPLAVSSVVGTLSWGFGDVVARWFGAA